ncbi:MAG: hypothetical protein M3O41_09590 [Pseudomonadota bacterium]|nr:hypothetical protein [Pseudomonadota bacterium]
MSKQRAIGSERGAARGYGGLRAPGTGRRGVAEYLGRDSPQRSRRLPHRPLPGRNSAPALEAAWLDVPRGRCHSVSCW